MFSKKKIQFNLKILIIFVAKLIVSNFGFQLQKIKGFYLLILFLFLISISSGAKLNNTRCPIEPTELSVEKFSATYDGDTIYFCCRECVDIFEASPELFLQAIDDIKTKQQSFDNKPLSQKAFDSIWNFFFYLPGTSIIIIAGLIIFILRKKIFVSAKINRAFKNAVIALLFFDICYSQHLSSRNKKIEILENEIHSTTFLEYGTPLIPAISKQQPSLRKTYYRGNDERNPALYNGGNYRTAEFTIDLCNNLNEPANYDELINSKDLYLRVRIMKSPNTAKHFWQKGKMGNIYATSNSKKFHWYKDQITDAVYLNNIGDNQWEFKYPLEEFILGEDDQIIRGIVYLCEKRKSSNNMVIGGRFHYAFQFDLKLFSKKFDNTSDLWMGPLYRKRSLRIWEIPEKEWLSSDPIPINEKKNEIKNPTLLGIDK